MKNLFILFLWLCLSLAKGLCAYTEFYCDFATGANINAGDDKTISTTTNGSYSRGTGAGGTDVFLATGGTPFSSASVGDFVSVYADAATVSTFVGRITAINTGGLSIDISLTVISGTRPATAATGNSATIGGKWKGPNGTDGFPFTIITGALQNSSTNTPRINFKTGSNYAVTAAITVTSNAGPITWQGYTSSPGDGGYAVLDGGTSGTSYIVLTTASKNNTFVNFIFQNNGATSSADLVSSAGGSENLFYQCVFATCRGNGILLSGANTIDCEAYGCNASNSTSKGGFAPQSSGVFMINCISHHNTGSNNAGYQCDGGVDMINCIASDNGFDGFRTSGDVLNDYYGCVAYNNGGSGINVTTAGIPADAMLLSIINCSFVKNTGAGIKLTAATSHFINGVVLNCAFGAGTQANGAGNYVSNVGGSSSNGSSIEGWIVSGQVNLASNVTPWVAPTTGDFRNTLASVKGAGWGQYLQTYTGSTWTGTVAYPDIGAAQHQDSGGGGQRSFVVP